MTPGTMIECGMTIAEIQDEMPFTKFKVYTYKDSIIAESEYEILDLFEKTLWGKKNTLCISDK